MSNMKLLKQYIRSFSSLAAMKSKWKNLAAYVSNEKDALCMKELHHKISEAEKTVEENVEEESEKVRKIDWEKWINKIGNKEVLFCMKKFYDAHMSVLDRLEKEEHHSDVSKDEIKKESIANRKDEIRNDELSTFFENTVKHCKEAEEASNLLLVNGAKALWINFHNPLVENVDNNEWIESDLYWKAFTEKHAVYNTNNKSLEPEDEENQNKLKNEWHKKTTTFNERSDTPILYDYMINLPSWEYYDINRRVFLENLIYFLLRSGANFRLFPELLNWKWLTHIEDLRFRFLEVSLKRKNQLQLQKEKREMALELQPIDYERHGEEFHYKLLVHMKMYQTLVLARLMANFIFLCDPYIPIQTKESLNIVQAKWKGKLYKLDEDDSEHEVVSCLFFLPDQELSEGTKRTTGEGTKQDGLEDAEEKNKFTFTPLNAMKNFHSFLNKKQIQLNPSYSQFLYIYSEVLEERGIHWLHVPNESIQDSFLRRYDKRDSLYPIFTEYVMQKNERFAKKKEIPLDNYEKAVEKVEQKYQAECAFFNKFVKTFLSDDMFNANEENKIDPSKIDPLQLDHFKNMGNAKIKEFIDLEQIPISDLSKNNKIKTYEQLLEYIKKEEIEKQEIREFVKGLPI